MYNSRQRIKNRFTVAGAAILMMAPGIHGDHTAPDPRSAKEFLAETYSPDSPNEVHQASREYMEGLVSSLPNGFLITRLSARDGEHYVSIRGGHLNDEPIVSIFENGRGVGTLEVLDSKLKPSLISQALEHPASPGDSYQAPPLSLARLEQ